MSRIARGQFRGVSEAKLLELVAKLTQIDAIRHSASEAFGATVGVWLFGSRTDDQARGGDLDLYIETEGLPADTLRKELQLYATLQRRLGEQRIDSVVHRKGTPMRPIDTAARQDGVRL